MGTAACASITGLDDYTKSQCAGPCTEKGADAATGSSIDASQAPAADTPPVLTVDTPEAPEVDTAQDPEAGNAGSPSASDGDGAEPEAGLACTWGCGTSAVSGYSCPKGACNTPQGACAASGQRCYCASDSQCRGGKCVKNLGENDLSCGSACSGSGPHDGFNCTLTNAGIPVIAPTGFGYTPSNFNPSRSAVPGADTLIDCSATYDTRTHSFTSWCAGQPSPGISANVPQSGGPAVDVLSFRGLTILPSGTLNVSSDEDGNAVILAVYGNAFIQGAIHSDGNHGVSGTNVPGTSGPGGNFNCDKSAGQDRGKDGHCSGGSGAGASAAGGTGPGGVGGIEVAGGVARPNALLQPLYGGCPGGISGSWACITSGGGGGGALQISAAGTLMITGSITANGGDGGTSTCQASGCKVYGGGGGGGGSGGAILLEGEVVTLAGSTISVNGGRGGGALGGATGGEGGTASSPTGQAGTGHSADGCGPPTECGGGGGGAFGYLVIHSLNPSVCGTTLVPTPAANPSGSSCVCVADSNCPSGKCVNAYSRCTDWCTGLGTADAVGCELPVSVPSSWSCATGNCSTVSGPDGACTAEALPCWCTRDSDCPEGKCADWAGCAERACTATGTGDGFHCVY